jgi:hypothetical protein
MFGVGRDFFTTHSKLYKFCIRCYGRRAMMILLQTQMNSGHDEQDLLLDKKRETLSHHASNVRPSVTK